MDDQRIYHHHVRKTAGSSLNSAFWRLGGFEGLDNRRLTGTVTSNGLRFVGPNSTLIEEGDYFFSTSHFPSWWIKLPEDTFTVTILRDPVKRLVSYYRYLLWGKANPGARGIEPFIDHIVAEGRFIEGGAAYAKTQLTMRNLRQERSTIQALGPGPFVRRLVARPGATPFETFLKRAPTRHLLAQLHMFSERLDPVEAAENALACSAVMFTETFPEDIERLRATTGLDLVERHERRLGEPIELSEREEEKMRERLAPEIEMIELVKAGL